MAKETYSCEKNNPVIYAISVTASTEEAHGEHEGHTGSKRAGYRIYWHISPPNVARARQMPSVRRGLIEKGGL
jgi:hypothetical protein